MEVRQKGRLISTNPRPGIKNVVGRAFLARDDNSRKRRCYDGSAADKFPLFPPISAMTRLWQQIQKSKKLSHGTILLLLHGNMGTNRKLKNPDFSVSILFLIIFALLSS
jgi:hypothetical protein